MDRHRGVRVQAQMRCAWLLATLAVACGGAPSPARVATSAPPPVIEPPCKGDACSAPVEKEARYELPDNDAQPTQVNPTASDTASCATVGVVAASAELGNYADREALAPAITSHTQRCEQLGLAIAARTCAAQQKDLRSIEYCAPGMAPDQALTVVTPTACVALFKDIDKRLAGRPFFDYEVAWWTPRSSAFLTSCKSDRWTQSLADCVKIQRADYCVTHGPGPLLVTLQALIGKENQRLAEEAVLRDKAYAEPTKYPKVKIAVVKPGACAQLVRSVTKRYTTTPQPNLWERDWWVPRAKNYEASCKKDRWTVELGACIRLQHAGNCHQYAPAMLREKLYAVYNAPVTQGPSNSSADPASSNHAVQNGAVTPVSDNMRATRPR